jgi:hypothetical protein
MFCVWRYLFSTILSVILLALKNFFKVELTNNEKNIALEAVSKKYIKALNWSIFYVVLFIFPILFLDTSVILSVLIPTTMVAGTAWFSISLANMKQKFEDFGLELTTNIFEAFTISIGILFALSVLSMSSSFWSPFVSSLPYQTTLQMLSMLFGLITLANIIFKIFVGFISITLMMLC